MKPIPSTSVAIAAAFVIALAPTRAETAAAATSADDEVVKLDDYTVEDARVAPYTPPTVAKLGPLGARDLLDTPLSLNLVTADLIQNTLASSPDDLFRINPVTQLTNPQSRFFSTATLRGFSPGSTKRIDGLPSSNSYSTTDLEDKEQVEIITGLSGFLYGTGNVGGTVNYVLKRPTAQRLTRITTGFTGGTNAYLHTDLGGPLDSAGTFGYRLNLLAQDGDTATDFQSIERQFASGAFDWHLSDSLLLQFDASYSFYRMEGSEAYWATSGGVAYPDAPDADRFYGQPYSFSENVQHQLGAGLEWTLRPGLRFRARYAHRETRLDLIAVNNTFVAGEPGDYTIRAGAWEYPDIATDGYSALFDTEFTTGLVGHTLTAGYYGDRDERTNFRGGGWALQDGTYNLASPVLLDTPPAPPTTAKYDAQRSLYHNLIVGDDLRFSTRWSALLGANYATIVDDSFNATGDTIASYKESRLTPTASVIFKPRTNLSFYGSYIESLEKGGTAGTTYNGYAVVNAGAVMAPLVSEQFELGAKLRLGPTLFTAALFQIDKGLQYYDVSTPTAPVYVQDGRQVHRGLEVTVSGNVLERLTLVGGFTLLDAAIKEHTQDPTLEGKTPADVAEFFAKLYAEYDLGAPGGLILTGGVYHTGAQFVNAANSDEIPAFTTADLGLRYATRLADHPVTLRLNLTNLTDESYWLKSNYVGAPRTVRLSTAFEF